MDLTMADPFCEYDKEIFAVSSIACEIKNTVQSLLLVASPRSCTSPRSFPPSPSAILSLWTNSFTQLPSYQSPPSFAMSPVNSNSLGSPRIALPEKGVVKSPLVRSLSPTRNRFFPGTPGIDLRYAGDLKTIPTLEEEGGNGAFPPASSACEARLDMGPASGYFTSSPQAPGRTGVRTPLAPEYRSLGKPPRPPRVFSKQGLAAGVTSGVPVVSAIRDFFVRGNACGVKTDQQLRWESIQTFLVFLLMTLFVLLVVMEKR